MQLKKIKIAGFKSFVDPTVVMLPSNLVAVVGPNGCGKSNIIDAVTWVMGESSAKYLRGESLTDVIFNGSTARKPVGMASVELVFDNQDGTLGGEYASYAEISIRRQISREAESAYFLNGVRCRRRDIIDIFLGTGLGPRSYSIIGQNMISRIIEAKPDDMRTYLEEAAGVSKYKERRRETENRIQHTKDNLARLSDVRSELEKQLGTLKRQANAAEKFQILKQEERVMKAQWLSLQWRDLDLQRVNETLQIQQQATKLEAQLAEITDINLQLEYKREAHSTENETFQEVQRRYYAIGSDITRLEQDIHHHQERQKQWQLDIEQVTHDWQNVKDELDESEEKSHELAMDIEELNPAAGLAAESVKSVMQKLTHAEQAMQEWQNHSDEFNQSVAKHTQVAQVEQTRIQHIEQNIAALTQRKTKLEHEKAQFDFSTLENEVEVISEQLIVAMEQVDEHNSQLADSVERIKQVRGEQQKTTERLNEVRNQLQVFNGQQASLSALQTTAIGKKDNPLMKWLAEHNLDQHPRLAENVEVEAGWELAVEKVLGSYLQAVCMQDMQDVASLLGDFKQGNLCMMTKSAAHTNYDVSKDSLLSKVTSAWPLESVLSNVYIAESQDEAFAKSASLKPNESIITRDGVWLGASWARVARDDNPEAGIFQRDVELKQLAKQIAALTETEHELEQALAQYREQLKELEIQRDSLQKAVNQSHAKSAEIQAQQKMMQQRFMESRRRAEQFESEYHEAVIGLEQAQTELTTSRSMWQQAMSALEDQATQRESLANKREVLRNALQQSRNEVNQVKDHAHELEIRLQTSKSQHASLKQSILRLKAQWETLSERKSILEKEANSSDVLEKLREDLSKLLNARLSIEADLNTARTTMDMINQQLKTLELRRTDVDREVQHLREILESLRVASQGIKIKAETVIEQLNETGFVLEDVLKEIPEAAVCDEWHRNLEQITQRISRLGAINLVAIEEYATCSERKEYLDKQDADLQEGLATLENAIAKIDKETRSLFKDTFDKVNNRFQELFPKVFGGGRAYLELTGENLLDAGISVMACPPGKRNSTIHLLSGGEKALTAIALVFSIFHLNPAPFCLLDEVDAPLDDANIGRFCTLVKSMSEKTQFIFISHNKLAIEMGENLIGVTMHEPGVSRLVSVDVHEAMSLAGA
jgi:chromosome segregation protein